MNSKSTLGSSLAFVIKNGKDIREIVRLIQAEAQKEHCSEPDITLISTAVSEVCRKLIVYSGMLEFTFTILNKAHGIELRCKAHIPAAPSNADWDALLQNLNAYFIDTSVKEHSNSHSLSYSFRKHLPRAVTHHSKP